MIEIQFCGKLYVKMCTLIIGEYRRKANRRGGVSQGITGGSFVLTNANICSGNQLSG